MLHILLLLCNTYKNNIGNYAITGQFNTIKFFLSGLFKGQMK